MAWLAEAETLTAHLLERARAQSERIASQHRDLTDADADADAMHAEQSSLAAELDMYNAWLDPGSSEGERYRLNKAVVEERDRRLALETEARALRAKIGDLGRKVRAIQREREAAEGQRVRAIEDGVAGALQQLSMLQNIDAGRPVSGARSARGAFAAKKRVFE